MLTWLAEELAEGAELHATDTDADAIAWVREHLPFVEARTNEPLPPLSYPDGYFDLVYNHSVFTHIDEHMQDAWLAELRRVTRPGGHVVLTVHGEHAFSQTPDPPWADFEQRGIVFVAHAQEPFPAWYGVTYHATWYVFARWSRWLRIRAYVPRGALGLQDMILLERRADGEIDPYAREDGRQVTDAIAAVEALLARGPDRSSRSRYGIVGTSWRRLLAVLLRNYSTYQRDVDRALVDALRRLQGPER